MQILTYHIFQNLESIQLFVALESIRASSYYWLVLIFNANSLAFAAQAEIEAQELLKCMKSPDVLPKSLSIFIPTIGSS